MLKIGEKIEIMLLERKKNIKDSMFDYVRYKQLNWYGPVRRMIEGRLSKKN